MRLVLSFLFFLLFLQTTWSQEDYPRDTSYSIQAAYLQIKRAYPEVQPIAPFSIKGIKSKRDLGYKEVPGRSLHIDIFYPKKRGKERHPGVLMIHGGGWASGSKNHQVPMAQKLAEAGYVAVAVEYRLSPESAYPAGVYDLKDALRWMRLNARKFGLAPDKIATLGCSAGATLASLLGTSAGLATLEEGHKSAAGSEVQAVINIDGVVSFIHPEAYPEWTGRAANQWLGPYGTDSPHWKEASPLEYAGAGSPPFLFINSSQPRFHAGRDDLISVLNEHSIYSEVHTLAGSPHSFWLVYPWFEPTLRYVLDFLGKIF